MGGGAAVVSYRLGGADGVSVEAAKWQWALERLGWSVRRVAGELLDGARPGDVGIPGLSIVPPAGAAVPTAGDVAAALGDAALVVVENVCSLPLNPGAARAVAAAVAGRPGTVVFHHHDLPWQREATAAVTGFPPRLPGARHVTINDRSRRELEARGLAAVTVRNAFDLDAPPGDRDATRAAMGIHPEELVVLHPVRAIPRKDVPAALAFAEHLDDLLPARRVRYWITGPAEDGYGPAFERVLAAARVPVTVGRVARAADAYAAADVVVLASTWEGFGNALVESAVAGRPLAVARFPVLEEMEALGMRFFDVDRPGDVAGWLRDGDRSVLAANLAVARRHFDLAALPARLRGIVGTPARAAR